MQSGRRTKEYEERTDTNSPTGPNEAARVVHYYNINLIEAKGEQNGRLLITRPSMQPNLAGRGSDTM